MLQDLNEIYEVKNNLEEDIQRMYNNREEIIWDKWKAQNFCLRCEPYTERFSYMLEGDNTIYYDEREIRPNYLCIRYSPYYDRYNGTTSSFTYFKIGKNGQWEDIHNYSENRFEYVDGTYFAFVPLGNNFVQNGYEIYFKSTRQWLTKSDVSGSYGLFDIYLLKNKFSNYNDRNNELNLIKNCTATGNLFSLIFGNEILLHTPEELYNLDGIRHNLFYQYQNHTILNYFCPNEIINSTHLFIGDKSYNEYLNEES